MDNRSFITRLSKTTGKSTKETAQTAAALIDIIAEKMATGHNVAVPGFGSLDSSKSLEYVGVDTQTGRKALFPPKINVSFTPGTRLKKNVAKS